MESGERDADGANGSELKADRQWEEIKPNPFKTQKVSYVICLNSMG
jgi:hypothetical protein